MQVSKARIVEALRTRLRDNLEAITAAQGAAQSGAVHEETRQEDPKDTRAIEATYLARGLAERVETLRNDIASVGTMLARTFSADDAIAIGALVALEEEDGSEKLYFLARCGGGERLEVDGLAIHVLNPTSPLGSALIEKHVDDEIELELPNRQLVANIIRVA